MSGKSITLVELQKEKLRQWLVFFRTVLRQGISLNRLNLRIPTILLCTNACQHRISRFSLALGQAWRFEILTVAKPPSMIPSLHHHHCHQSRRWQHKNRQLHTLPTRQLDCGLLASPRERTLPGLREIDPPHNILLACGDARDDTGVQLQSMDTWLASRM